MLHTDSEHFVALVAALSMPQILAHITTVPERAAVVAVDGAEALLKELNKRKENGNSRKSWKRG